MSTDTWNFLILLVYNLLFWGLYLVFHLGLVIFYSFKMNKEFVYLSAIYICVSQLTGIGMGLIPGITDIQIFGNTSTVNEVLRSANVECIIFAPNILPQYNDLKGTYDWGYQLLNSPINFYSEGATGANYLTDQIAYSITSENLTKSFSLVIYALMYSFVYAFCNAGIFIIGGSSMGTESIAIYISEKKNKDVGTTLKFIQMGCLIAGILMGSYATGIIAGNAHTLPGTDPFYKEGVTELHQFASAATGDYASWQYIFNANLVASLLYVFVNGALINSLFPTLSTEELEAKIAEFSEGKFRR